MKKLEQLYEGKAKKVFMTDDPDVVIVDYKDDATAFNGEKKGTIVGKGVVNNRMTNHVFKLMEKEGVPTHLVEELSDRETAVKKDTSFRLKLSFVMWQQEVFPREWVWKKEKNFFVQSLNLVIKMMI